LEQEILSYIKGKLGSVKGVIISDYAKGVISPDIFTPFLDARTDIEIKRLPLLIDPKPSNLSTYKCATVIKPNRSEAERLSGKEIHNKDDAIAAGRILLEKWDTEMVLITLGDLGMVLVSKDDQQFPPFAIDTEAREVYDVSGAGDTVSAVFTLGLAAGISPYDSARLANYAAGIVVGEIGTVAVTSAALRQVLDENL
jgi:rfaE bifunctional protein kinase chain/domain